MGILRFLFALTVVIFHSRTSLVNNITTTNIAVHSFFILSGFYMAYIYREKYIHKMSSYKLFVTNRLLRIYPVYWTVLLLIIGVALLKLLFHIGSEENVLTRLFAFSDYERNWKIIQNVFFIITPDYWIQPFKNPDFLVGPQVWSLQVEVPFYLLVPFILKDNPRTILLRIAIILIIVYALIIPLHIVSTQSLLYLFLTNIIFFAGGIISYLMYTMKIKYQKPSVLPLVFIISFLLILPTMEIMTNIFYVCLVLCIPSIFLYTKSNRIDKFVGSLSYPLFIAHIFFGSLVAHILHIKGDSLIYSVIFVITAIGGAILLTYVVDNPLNIYRQKRFEKAKKA